jgi:HPt (histidine-containing phosphotransfer) domain-containing protein
MNDVLVKPFKRKDLETMLVFWANKSLAIEEPPQTAAPVSERHLWDASVFDFTALVDTFLGKRSTVIDLLGRFITKTRTQLSEIEASIAASDAKSVREAAHSIKGASWNLSAQALGDAAKELEDASKNGDLDRASGRLKVLSDRMEEFESCAGYYIRLSQDERE